MRRPRKYLKLLPNSIVAMMLAAGASRASGQSIYLARTEPDFTLPQLRYIKMDAEYEDVSFRSKTGGGTTEEQRLYLAPTIGIGWDYFIYHPDLLTFSVLAEPGYTWQQNNFSGASSQQDSLLLNGNFNATLLQLKPYSTVLNYNRSHEDYHYDFFNSATVDEESYGATWGYREGAVPVTVSIQHTTRDSSGLSLNSTAEQTTASLHAQNTRSKGDYTDLNYQFSQYDSSSTFASETFQDSSTTHYVTLTDAEHFGKNTLNSSLNYNEQEEQGASSDNLNATLDFNMEHTAYLRSFYDYSFARYSSGDVESIDHLARVGLQHQLYESLVSTIDVHGALTENTSPGTSLEQQSVGSSASMNYSKRLGEWGHLSIGDSASYDLTRQDSTGSILFINNESHTVPPSGLFFLNQPLDLNVQSITYFNGTVTVTLVHGTAPAGDYDVITTTDPWQIRIYSGGPNLINLSSSPVVQVNYTVQPNPSGRYSTFNNQFQIRLGFWQQRAGLYLRYNFTENHADSAAFVLENVSEFQIGGDVSWNGFRADANFTDRHSSLYDFQSVTLSEGYARRISPHTTAGIDLRQQWSTYPNAGTNSTPDLTDYSFTAHCDWQPVSSLNWNTEAGYEQQRGAGVDQDLIVFRSYLNWFVGKLDFRLGYEFQNQEYTAETRERHFVFLRVRRNF